MTTDYQNQPDREFARESPKRVLSLEDLVFREATKFLAGRTVSPLDGIYVIGQHCAVSVHLVLVENAQFELTVSCRAFHPELVDWRKRSVVADRDKVSYWFHLSREGIAAAPTDPGTFRLNLMRHLVPVPKPVIRPDAPLLEATVPPAALVDQQARLLGLQDRLVAQKEEIGLLAIQHGRIEEFDIDLYTRRIGERTAIIAVGWNVQNEHLEGATILVLYVNQLTRAIVERVSFPLVRVNSLPAEIVELFSIEGATREPCWFGRWDAPLQLATDCFIEGTVVPRGA